MLKLCRSEFGSIPVHWPSSGSDSELQLFGLKHSQVAMTLCQTFEPELSRARVHMGLQILYPNTRGEYGNVLSIQLLQLSMYRWCHLGHGTRCIRGTS